MWLWVIVREFKMLAYFKIQNFKSILDLTLDLSFAEGKLPNGHKDYENLIFVGDNKNRFVPTLALYGANASGKTNILEAFFNFQSVIAYGIQRYYKPNKLNDKYNYSSFELGLLLNGKKYTYTLKYNADGIIFEGLYKDFYENKKPVFEIDNTNCFFETIATKEYTAQRLKEIYKVECLNERQNQWQTFLACITKNYKGLNKVIPAVCNYIFYDIELYGFNQMPLTISIDKLAKSDSMEAITKAFDKITNILKKLDIDITKMTIDRQIQTIDDSVELLYGKKGGAIVDDKIYSYHLDNKGNEVRFNFLEESEGTQTVAGLLGLCLSALEDGKVLFIDELEKSLHPLLLVEIVRLFKDKSYNTKGAQLIFTAHNTDILDNDLMRVSEIGIINKNVKDGTSIKRLSEFNGVRNVSNFRKQYLEGLFSGIPYPYI